MKMPSLAPAYHCGSGCRLSDSIVGWYCCGAWARPIGEPAIRDAANAHSPRILAVIRVPPACVEGIIAAELEVAWHASDGRTVPHAPQEHQCTASVSATGFW